MAFDDAFLGGLSRKPERTKMGNAHSGGFDHDDDTTNTYNGYKGMSIKPAFNGPDMRCGLTRGI
jgi:hypothetical protein